VAKYAWWAPETVWRFQKKKFPTAGNGKPGSHNPQPITQLLYWLSYVAFKEICVSESNAVQHGRNLSFCSIYCLHTGGRIHSNLKTEALECSEASLHGLSGYIALFTDERNFGNTIYIIYVVLRTPQWTHNQPTGSDRLHSHGTKPHVKKYH